MGRRVTVVVTGAGGTVDVGNFGAVVCLTGGALLFRTGLALTRIVESSTNDNKKTDNVAADNRLVIFKEYLNWCLVCFAERVVQLRPSSAER